MSINKSNVPTIMALNEYCCKYECLNTICPISKFIINNVDTFMTYYNSMFFKYP